MISGDLLREARRRSDLSQAELARRAGKATSVIGQWERGEVRPSLETLREVIRACDLELSFRLSESDADGDDHDLALVERSLRQSPAERLAHGVRATRSLQRMRAHAAAGPGG